MSRIMQDYILVKQENGVDLLEQFRDIENLSVDCEWWSILNTDETEIKKQEGKLNED